MYYHSRALKYVVYGKVGPTPPDQEDPYFHHAYRWLGCQCGFYPQVWLARGSSGITGYRQAYAGWARRTGQSLRRKRPSQILFGFDLIKGFPVDFDLWSITLGVFGNAGRFHSLEESNRMLAAKLDDFAQWAKDDGVIDEMPFLLDWERHSDLERRLERWLFVENDQVVVPSLNLKAAKRIVCRNERQKKALRRMGFIEDRIVIKNAK